MAKKNEVLENIEEIEVPGVNEDILEQYVEFELPMARAGEEQQIFVGFQGFNRLIPRGQVVYIPRKVAEHLRQSLRLQAKYERSVAMTYEQDEQTRRALG